MSDYQAVTDALAKGADPAMLCTTCPWDRTCIAPPQMTKSEIDAKLAEAGAKDDDAMAKAKAEGKAPGMPVGSLLTLLTIAGRDTSAQVCPVFAMRLRSGAGRQIADSLRSSMQGWDDQS